MLSLLSLKFWLKIILTLLSYLFLREFLQFCNTFCFFPPLISRKLGLIARCEDELSVLLSISADVVGDDPVFWSDWKSRFVGHLQNCCVVVKRNDFPTIGAFIKQYFCLLKTIEYYPVSNVFAVFLHVNYILDVHDVLQMTTGSEE